ncbi:MAG: endopeptidase La [Clostridiales bacterium]|nr:endopeptidase La [Clostridiales bacterium]
MQKKDETKLVFPCIALRGVTAFPGTITTFDVGREKSLRALDKAVEGNKLLYVATQINDDIQIPTFADMYEIGTLVYVKQVLKMHGDVARVLVEGVTRAKVGEIVSEDEYLAATIYELKTDIGMDNLSLEDKTMLRLLRTRFMEYAELFTLREPDSARLVFTSEEPVFIVDCIANQLDISYISKQKILEESDFHQRLVLITTTLEEEIEIAKMENQISEDLKKSMDENQKEYVLREKMKVIQSELGIGDEVQESENWSEKLRELNLDETITKKVQREIDKYSKMPPSSPESSVIRNYVETILELPWNTSSKENSDLKKAERILERDHYGLSKVKERILEYLAVVHLSKGIKGPILCLVGPPGVGKTSIARSIASATGREFVRMSLGGVRDEAEIRGHRRTYIGAIPGRIITSLKDAGTDNPLFLFDEVDKIGADFKGDPADALLEVLDPEQNNTFKDHFLDVPFDLSKIMFITTANTIDTIPRPLLDRMEVIEVSGYTEEEKIKIAQKYLIPKKLKEHGLTKDNLKISKKTISDIINFYTRESGVRNLEREIANLCRKVARKVVTEAGENEKDISDIGYRISPSDLEEYLGKKKFRYDTIADKAQVGIATGMAWTVVGGDTLSIETSCVSGSGKLQLTGNLGDVMQESAKAAVTYIRSIADEIGIEENFYKNLDIHIHVPEGAVPKDGPSAGVTMFTSVVSALMKKPIRNDVSMTGEITLRGKILPVGGIKEKVLAAHRAGIKKVLLPRENERDIEEIPESVRNQLKFVLLNEAKDALKEALV